jgi:deoxyribonuclease V
VSLSELFYKEKMIGKVARTRSSVKPVFVFPGYKITLKEVAEWILKTSIKYRIHKPNRQSHISVNRLRLKFEKENNI